MSLERVIKALIGLGLTRLDAEVYVYLGKKGPQKPVDLAKALSYNKKKIYSSLKNLRTKGLVSKDRTIFSALPFEEALDLLIKMEKERAQAMHESREELLTTWETKD
ncbi:MAG: helix-turn-helix domain-containing protein [Asgard group archaeon]